MRVGIERRVPGRAARRAGPALGCIFLCLFPLSSFYFSLSFVRRERVVGDREAPV